MLFSGNGLFCMIITVSGHESALWSRNIREEGRLEPDRGQVSNGDEADQLSSSAALSMDEFSDLFRKGFRVLWLIAAGIVADRLLAEDIVQEAAVVALQKREQFQRGSSFTAWMGQIVRFIAMNHNRKENRRATTAQEAGVIESGTRFSGGVRSPSPHDKSAETPLHLDSEFNLPADQAQFDDLVVKALNEVHPEGRSCLLLRVVEGLDYKEISRIFDIPAGTAMSHVSRSKQILRERLAELAPKKNPPTEVL